MTSSETLLYIYGQLSGVDWSELTHAEKKVLKALVPHMLNNGLVEYDTLPKELQEYAAQGIPRNCIKL